jgi:hypothetical protein
LQQMKYILNYPCHHPFESSPASLLAAILPFLPGLKIHLLIVREELELHCMSGLPWKVRFLPFGMGRFVMFCNYH